MTPPHQKRRIGLIVLFGAMLCGGVYLMLTALKENTEFFYNPSDVVSEGFIPKSQNFRIGGLVVKGSLIKNGGLTTQFKIKDFEREMPWPISVSYTGVLPDLFREGQGVVVLGSMVSERDFIAKDVLAKHDENYQPDISYQTSPET